MRIIEATVNLAVVAAALFCAATLISRRPNGPDLHKMAQTFVGKRLPLPQKLVGHQPNVLLVVTAKCDACARSMPFYRELSRPAGS